MCDPKKEYEAIVRCCNCMRDQIVRPLMGTAVKDHLVDACLKCKCCGLYLTHESEVVH